MSGNSSLVVGFWVLASDLLDDGGGVGGQSWVTVVVG